MPYRLIPIVLVIIEILAFPGFAGTVSPAGNGLAGVPALVESIRFEGKITLCGEMIPHEDPEIREQLEKEMMLALWNRPQVILWLKRASRLFPHIRDILNQEKLPEDLKYVAVVESALRADARSSQNAVGYWQFMKGTGLKYGLRIDSRVDERCALLESTRAACRYIKALHDEFGSYLLTFAAYNMGEFGLRTEIEAQETRHFFSLYLPEETQRYVFKIVAAKLIMEHPEIYGFYLTPKDLYPKFTYSLVHFSMGDEIPLSLVARAGQVSFKTLKDYNPQIRGYDLSPGKNTLLLPEGREKGFKERFLSLHAAWKKTDRLKIHVVKTGESLTGIAQAYQMSLAALLRLNRFSYNHLIHPGDRIRVR